MQDLGFEQTFTEKKNVMKTISCALLWPISNKHIYKK